jgi:SAM-dependent methyltransferase
LIVSAESTYLLDNANAKADTRMDVLARLYDEPTQRALERVGVGAGWHCLEVGGGGGSVARWLAALVGPKGRVLCTDINTRIIDGHRGNTPGNLEVQSHDIANDPLPEAAFDLVHARLVLIHVPQRERALERMVAALKPGGWLVIEDFDALSLLPDPAVSPAESRLESFDAMRAYFARAGADSRFGRTLYGRFRGLKLESISAEGRLLMWTGANDGAALMRLNFEQVAAGLVDGGLISAERLRADIARLGDDDYAAPSPIMWTVAGRKPATDSTSQQG